MTEIFTPIMPGAWAAPNGSLAECAIVAVLRPDQIDLIADAVVARLAAPVANTPDTPPVAVSGPVYDAGTVLLPCPFCGKDAELIFRHGFISGECKHCASEGAVCATKADAIAAWNTRALPIAPTTTEPLTSEDVALIERMVDRFLAWKLPVNFTPDAGISFKANYNEGTAYPMKHEPVGTNLFTAVQAEAMVRHMINGLPMTPELSVIQEAYGLLWSVPVDTHTFAGAAVSKARKLLLAAMTKDEQRAALASTPAPDAAPAGDAMEAMRIAEAVGQADASFGYNLQLTRLVDGETTYTLTIEGVEPGEYDDREDALLAIDERRAAHRANAIRAALAVSRAPVQG